MDKKSANGLQTKASEGGVQRKQLPYSVETPYGFHLDLDFLKYVDDIEKGNTIKRVHIQRRIKGPPKFSTLPRNFSLPGHGVRPVSRETAWSGTSTLGPKPKSRVTEVQQIYDFSRPNEGGTSSQSGRVPTSPGGGYVPLKPREDTAGGVRDVDEKNVGIQNRPNLLRASSMPITLQQRKGSDSSSPDRTVGTPESGSTENMFRASPDVTERRCVPQDRTGLHQQITVALKRVRELEEQVKTIPELKAQICSLREEREKLLLQLQAQVAASSSTVSSESRTHTKPQGHRPSEGLSLALTTQHTRGAPDKALAKPATVKKKEANQEPVKSSSAHEEKEVEEQTEKQDKQKDTLESPVNHAVQKQDGVTYSEAALEGKVEDSESTKMLREKLMILETKLNQASKELERTNSLLKEQLDENKVKEEKILQLSEGLRVEVCTPEFERPRRESIDAGTETEKVVVANQETETESPGTVDQGTDTDRICIEVCVPTPAAESTDRGTESAEIQAQEQATEMEAELAAVSPPRPRANSMERGTVTERIPTQDQMTETPVAERVNQVTETEGETVTDHPHRPRASSVDRGTETERVDTVDRVTETEVAQRVDQQTGTETDRRPDNNPGRGAEAESHVREIPASARLENIDAVVSEREEEANERIQREEGDSESVNVQVIVESSIVVAESRAEQIVISEIVSQEESHTIESAAAGESTESKTETVITPSDTERKEIITPKSEAKDVTETQQIAPETVEKKQTVDAEIVRVEVKDTPVTDVAVVEVERAIVPVRPQRGRKSSAEQVQPLQPLQPQAPAQAAPVRPRRGSSEAQKSQTQAKPQPQVQAQAQVQPQPETQTPTQVSEPQVEKAPSVPQVEEQAVTKKPSEEKEPQPEPQPETQTKSPAPAPSEVQIRPKSIQAQPQSPSTATRRDSKELKRGSSVTQPPSRASGEAQTPPIRQASVDTQPQSQGSRRSSSETQPPSKDASEKQVLRKGSTETVQRRGSSEVKASRRDSGESQQPRRASSDTVQRRGSSEAQAARRDSVEAQSARRGSGETAQRRGSSEVQAARRDSGEAHPSRRGSGETAQRRGSSEAQAARKDSGDAQTSRRGSSDSPTSPAALGQVVTRLTGLLGEQWAQLGSSSGTQQTASQQETPSAQKQTAGKRAEGAKGATAKFAGKAAPTASTGKPAGKPGPSKMSSIQSQLVSSLSVLSAFYSPGQKAASKQQEQGLKSIMKKNGVADKQGNKGAKKNLKFVGVNGGYETTSSEESSGDEKSKVEPEEEEDSSEPEVEKEEKEKEPVEKPEEGAETPQTGAEVSAEEEGASAAAAAAVKEEEKGLLDPDGSQELLDDPAEREKVDKGFLDACVYVKDRMEEVSSPDKEMRQVLVVLYQEWFKVSSQKDSQADTVRLYLRQVGLTTPTLLPYVVNLTDGNGNMALHYSVSHSNFPVVKLLLDTGLCETDNVNKAGYTPVMLAALTAAETPDDLEVAQQLLKLGDINACSRQAGQTALMLAVSHGRVAMVKLLLSCGADVNAQDREGSTALMCASEHGHTHIVRLLLETGRCDSSLSDKNGQTALAVAEGASHTDIVDLLKAHAASSEPSSTAGLL